MKHGPDNTKPGMENLRTTPDGRYPACSTPGSIDPGASAKVRIRLQVRTWMKILGSLMKKLCHMLAVCLLRVTITCLSSCSGSMMAEYPLPPGSYRPMGITAGPDNNIWFTELVANKIAKITQAGKITEYRIPTAKSNPISITVGRDKALWFTQRAGNKIGRMTTTGHFTEYAVPTPRSGPYSITSSPDGNIWFTEFQGKNIGRITTSGLITEYQIPPPVVNVAGQVVAGIPSSPVDITSGPDGNLWFTSITSLIRNDIWKISPSGQVTAYPVPSLGGQPSCITSGPDGNLWFTVHGGIPSKNPPGPNEIGKMTTDGRFTMYQIPTRGSRALGITSGPDGNLWFVEEDGNKVGKISTSGHISEYAIPTSGSRPEGITAGPDGTVWFTEYAVNKIGRMSTNTKR